MTAQNSPSVRVIDLVPGDVVSIPGQSACFVAQTTHPIWKHLRLVIWRMRDGSWSHDALDPRQIVGSISTSYDPTARAARIHAALVGQQDWTTRP